MTTRTSAAALAFAFFTATPTLADPGLYEAQFGGKAGMARIVADTMALVLADPRISDFFADTDQNRFQPILAEQLCSLIGGPCKYTGKDMKEAHGDFKIRTAHFNFLAEHLQVAMEKNGVPAWAQNKLVAKLAPMHRDVVKQP